MVCPDYLDDIAKAEFNRIVKEFKSLDIITSIDSTSLAICCDAYSKWKQATEFVKHTGLLKVKENRYGDKSIENNPAIKDALRYGELYRKMTIECGLTPNARLRTAAKETNVSEPQDGLIARKNGKSTMLSAIDLYMLVADGEGGAEIYSVATKKDQAQIIFNEAVNMVRQSPALSKHLRKRKSDIYFPLTFSKTFGDVNNESTFDIEELHDCYAVSGADLSSTTDLSCATLLVMKPGSDRKYVIQMYFLPEELLEQRVNEDKIPYDKWHDRGLLRLCSGNKVNYSDVTAWYVEMFQTYGIRPLWNYYDPWNSRYWVQEMDETGFEMVECRQVSKTLSQPMKEMEADLKAHNINYNNNPVLKWCLTNTSIERDKNDNIGLLRAKTHDCALTAQSVC